MKNLLLLLFLLIKSHLSHGAPHEHFIDAPSVHGMVLFGSEKLYLSHLPMFHAPHDYQSILEIELSAKAAITYKKAYRHGELYTIVPEKFSLPQMIKDPVPFKITIYKGHFERGGTPLVTGIVTIKKVLLHKKLSPQQASSSKYQGHLIGNAKELYLIHKITSVPGLDQISKVSFADTDVYFSKILKKQGIIDLFLQEQPNSLELSENQKYISSLNTQRTSLFEFKTLNIIYTEFGDLSF